MLFDEWAADQDPQFRRIFYQVLLPRLKEMGKTVIAISHDDLYFSLADRLLEMRQGRLTELTGEQREQVSRDAVAHLDGKDLAEVPAPMNPASTGTFMFEMKAASFAVNDRHAAAPHQPALRAGSGLWPHRPQRVGQIHPAQAAGPPAAPQRGEIRFDDQPLQPGATGTLPVRWPICPSTCRVPRTCSAANWWRWGATLARPVGPDGERKITARLNGPSP